MNMQPIAKPKDLTDHLFAIFIYSASVSNASPLHDILNIAIICMQITIKS